jgi:hypothetical protein
VAQLTSTGEGVRPVSGLAVGTSVFASCVMIMLGAFHAIVGLAALLENEFFVATRNYVFEFDVTAWGWIHLIAGLIVAFAGLGLFSGAVWARTVGVIVAVVSGIVNFMWLPYYPVWSALTIALDVLVIWALTVHGRDISEARGA